MHGWKSIALLLHFICLLVATNAMEIQLDQRGIGLLEGNETELICTFIAESTEEMISLEIMATNGTSSFETLALFKPNGRANLTDMGSYLHGRVELINSIKQARLITMRFIFLMCADEKEYRCRIRFFANFNQLMMETEAKKITVKASPLQPETVSQLNSTHLLEDKEHVTFQCYGNVGKPPGRYIWQKIRKNNIELTTYDNVTTVTTAAPHTCTYNGSSVFTIQVTVEDDQAVMRYVEQSMVSIYKDSKPIHVLYKVRTPKITKHPNQTYYVVGSGDIELKCHADGNPQSNYIWFKGDNMNQNLSTEASVVIDSKNTTNSGAYECHAFNSLNGKIYYQFQSVDIFIVHDIPTSSSTVIITTENKAIYQQPWFWISIILIVVIILLSMAVVHLVRARVPKAEKTSTYCDIKEQTLENNSYEIITSSQCSSNTDSYEYTGILNPFHGLNKSDKRAKAAGENKTAFKEANIKSPTSDIDEISLHAMKTYENMDDMFFLLVLIVTIVSSYQRTGLKIQMSLDSHAINVL